MKSLISIIFLSLSIAVNSQYVYYYQNNFQNRSAGAYTHGMFVTDWNAGLYEWGMGYRTDVFDPYSDTIVDYAGDKVFRVHHEQGGYSATSGTSIETPLANNITEAYITYNVRFKPNFDFVIGGKLPGLGGGTFVVPSPPSGDQGWDGVIMWRGFGDIQCYTYDHAYTGQYGQGGVWNLNGGFTIVPGEWFNITIRYVMNTVGSANGIFEGYINGVLKFQAQKYEWHTSTATNIQKVTFVNFFGGGSIDFAASKDEYCEFDDLTVFRYTAPTVSGLMLSPVNRVLTLPVNFKGDVTPFPVDPEIKAGEALNVNGKNKILKVGNKLQTIRFN